MPRLGFDVKILNYSPVEFQHEVLKKGKVIFLRDETKRIEYESKLISTYLDFKGMYEFLVRGIKNPTTPDRKRYVFRSAGKKPIPSVRD